MSRALKQEVQQQIRSIGEKPTKQHSKRLSNLDLDQMFTNRRVRKNNKFRNFYNEIVDVFENYNAPQRKQAPFDQFIDNLNSKIRIRTEESMDSYVDIHKIIHETSPIRINYENFKTFQETVQKSQDSPSDDFTLAHFGNTVTTNAETDEEIEKITKSSSQKYSKLKLERGVEKLIDFLNKKDKRKTITLIKLQGERFDKKIIAVNMIINLLKNQLRSAFKVVQETKKSTKRKEKKQIQFLQENSYKQPEKMKFRDFSEIPRSPLLNMEMNFEEFLKYQIQQ